MKIGKYETVTREIEKWNIIKWKIDRYGNNCVMHQRHNEWNVLHSEMIFELNNSEKKQINSKTSSYIVSSFVANMPPLSTPHKCKNCVTAIKMVREQTRSKLVTSESNTDACRMRSHAAVEFTCICSSLKRWLWSFTRNTRSQISNSLSTLSMVRSVLPCVEFLIASVPYVSLHMNSLGLANGAVNIMHAINHAAGILHKNISRTFRRCHGPQFPISDKISFGCWCDADAVGFSYAVIMANLCMFLDQSGWSTWKCSLLSDNGKYYVKL